MIQIEIKLREGGTTKIKTTPNDFKITPYGISYTDPDLGFTKVETFDKIESFSLDCKVTDEMTEIAQAHKRTQSDKHPGLKPSANWTV